MDPYKILADYVKERDRATIAVVEGEDIEVFKAFAQKWTDLCILPPIYQLATDPVLEIMVRKMVLHEIDAPESTKEKARDWLLSHGYDLNIDWEA